MQNKRVIKKTISSQILPVPLGTCVSKLINPLTAGGPKTWFYGVYPLKPSMLTILPLISSKSDLPVKSYSRFYECPTYMTMAVNRLR